MTCTSCQQNQNDTSCMSAQAIPARDLPIDTFESAPDYFLTVRTKQDKNGAVKHQLMYTPGASVVPMQNMANVRPLPANNPALTVASGQVLPAYIENTGTTNIIRAADEMHPAQFLVLSVTDNNTAMCQNCGWVEMPVGHKYIIGTNYYRSNKEGEVTTDPSQTGQYLFTPVGRFTLALEIKRGV